MPHKKSRRPEKPYYRKLAPRAARAAGKGEDGGSKIEDGVDLPHAHPIAPSHFVLREDGQIEPIPPPATRHPLPLSGPETNRQSAIENRQSVPPRLLYTSDAPFVRLYHGNCLELLDAIYARYGDEGRFDMIFADPPYFLSNGGITCHAGKMVKVDKGDWDKSRGPELNHEFNTEWLRRCQRVLKPNGTLWVSGTQHVIFSIGYTLQQLGYKILNDITWEKPNPPPNLSCRYFTHSTETLIWAAKNEKSKHVFNYDFMRQTNGGKQMKSVWRMTASGSSEKEHGKHPTQKPVALVDRCLLASTNEGDMVMDPFLGGGTTAVACIRLNRHFIGIELDFSHLKLSELRTDHEIIQIWLRHFRVHITVTVHGKAQVATTMLNERRARSDAPYQQIDLDLFSNLIDRSVPIDEKPQVPTERIFHECKFVFLSCAEVERGAVVHTTVDVSLQEAWAKTPTGKKRETTHIVRCETEILRVQPVG